MYRKGLCGFFPVLEFALQEKLHGAKCCKFYGPEGVGAVVFCVLSEQQLTPLASLQGTQRSDVSIIVLPAVWCELSFFSVNFEVSSFYFPSLK